jgi:hypothetical protein
MTNYSAGALPRLSRALRISYPVHAIWTENDSQSTEDVERRLCVDAPNNTWPARAIRPGLACDAGRVPCTPFAGTPGNACRVDPRSRSNFAKLRVAMLALGVLAASLPSAKASAACQAPVDTFANPFSRESAHHRPIGGGAVFATGNHPSTISLLKGGFGNINSNNGWGINVYESTSADPLLTVSHAGPYNKIGVPVTLRVPQNADNLLTTDATVVIHDTISNTTHEFYYWRWNNGEPTAGIHRQWDTKALGHSQPGGPRVGTSASGVAGMFGLLRGHEVNTPGYKIEHAVQISLSHNKGSCGMQLQNTVVWPAASTDWYCKTDPDLCSGNIPYGALLALPSADIAGLGLSEPGERLAEALQNYGAYVVDGSECPTLRGDQDINAGILQTLKQDMRKIYPLLRMVLNNEADQTASGGGTPLAENCAFNSPDR